MEIHFYESLKYYPVEYGIYLDWAGTKNAIDNKEENIHTTQMCMLSTTLFLDGYKVFVHQDNGIIYEITLQNKDNHGDRAVRIAQNMYAMWASNVIRE